MTEITGVIGLVVGILVGATLAYKDCDDGWNLGLGWRALRCLYEKCMEED